MMRRRRGSTSANSVSVGRGAGAAFAVLVSTLALALTTVPAAYALPGQVYAFGENQFGQLGNATGTTTESPNPTPALIALPAGAGPVVEVAAGHKHSLLLTAGGQVFAVGSNEYGQLGIATNSGTASAVTTPAQVVFPGATGPVVQVAAGEWHSLALTSTGQLYGFGNNVLAQLGRTANATPNPTPAVAGMPGATGPVVQIAAGAAQSFAVTSTGQLFAFGRNRYGELARATDEMEQPNPPAEVILPGATGPVAQVSAGGDHTLALTSTGQLFAFGENYFGQLGNTTNNKMIKANATPALVGLPGASGRIVQVSAGLTHSLALTSSGQLYSFGINDEGELGIPTSGNATPNPTPALATLPGASGPIVQIAAAQAHSLAVTSSGQLFAFGSNRFGQLGNATNITTGSANATPALVAFPFGTTIDAVARGPEARHTLALVADLAVLSASLPAGQVGVPYHAGAAAAGGTGAYGWSASGLPAGLSIDTNGQITGTPLSAGASSVVLRVSDLLGITAPSAPIPLTIAPAGSGKPAPPGPHTFTTAQLKANLLAQLKLSGKASKIGALLKNKGYTLSFTALTAGSLSINWYFLPKGAHLSRKKAKPKPLLLASGKVSFKAPGKQKITIKLSSKGISFLRHKQSAKISLKGSFTPTGKKAVSAIKTLTLKR